VLVPDKPRIVDEADDVLADDLPDDEGQDGHDPQVTMVRLAIQRIQKSIPGYIAAGG